MLDSLAAGTAYSATVTDAAGCTATAMQSITSSCITPTNLREFNVQDTSAVLRWDTVCGASVYRIRYKVAGPGPWTTVIKNGNVGQRTVTGLTPNTIYRWTIQAKCGLQWSAISAFETFTTLTQPCQIPGGLSAAPVGADLARLNWTQVPIAWKYKIRWREQGTSTWNVLVKDAVWDKHWLTSLVSTTTYEWSIKTMCQPGVAGTPWSATQTFTTSPTPKTSLSDHRLRAAGPSLGLYPNPNTGEFFLNATGVEPVLVEVFDATGRCIHRRQSAGNGQIPVMLGSVAPGAYLLRATGPNISVNERFVVVR